MIIELVFVRFISLIDSICFNIVKERERKKKSSSTTLVCLLSIPSIAIVNNAFGSFVIFSNWMESTRTATSK